MDIHEFAKAKRATKDFQKWLLEEPQIMLDWAMWANGMSLEEIYEYLLAEFKCL